MKLKAFRISLAVLLGIAVGIVCCASFFLIVGRMINDGAREQEQARMQEVQQLLETKRITIGQTVATMPALPKGWGYVQVECTGGDFFLTVFRANLEELTLYYSDTSGVFAAEYLDFSGDRNTKWYFIDEAEFRRYVECVRASSN